MKWRRSYDARPPLMTKDHPHYESIVNDNRYSQVSEIPMGESLHECQLRVIDAWRDILGDVQNSRSSEPSYSLIVAHANTLRALIMHVDGISSSDIEGLNIPTGIPFYYDVEKMTGQLVSSSEPDANGIGKFSGMYIADERKKRSFLERRRAANDPYTWALRDEQVACHMLMDRDTDGDFDQAGLNGVEDDAAKNISLFTNGVMSIHS
jgi:hypothetical protein